METNLTGLALFTENLGSIEPQMERLLPRIPEFRRTALGLRRPRAAVAPVAAFCLLCCALGFVPQSFEYEQGGKPFIAGAPHFSLSHSGNCAAAAISSSPVGIDIEAMRPAPESVARRLSARDDRDFFRIWTLKESFVKMTGEGLVLPVQSIEVTGCVTQSHETALCQLGICCRESALELRQLEPTELVESYLALSF